MVVVGKRYTRTVQEAAVRYRRAHLQNLKYHKTRQQEDMQSAPRPALFIHNVALCLFFFIHCFYPKNMNRPSLHSPWPAARTRTACRMLGTRPRNQRALCAQNS